jgi:hypothetical protein
MFTISLNMMNALASHLPCVIEIEQCALTYWGISRQQIGRMKFTSIIRTNEKTGCVLMELLWLYTKSILGEHLHGLRTSDIRTLRLHLASAIGFTALAERQLESVCPASVVTRTFKTNLASVRYLAL